MPEQPGFEVSAFIPDAVDSTIEDAHIPAWCDLVLDVKRDGSNTVRQHLSRAAGEAIIDTVHSVLHPNHGSNSLDTMWHEMDFIFARLRMGEAADDDRGRAQGLAFGIACAINPFAPDVDEVRAEAADRFERYADNRAFVRDSCAKFGHKVYPHRPDQCAACGHLMEEGDRVNGWSEPWPGEPEPEPSADDGDDDTAGSPFD